MASDWILVNSHRRSGTHFLIDALVANIPAARFPGHPALPVDFNIGSLFRKDERVTRTFRRLLDAPGTVVIKSHLLPEELAPTPHDPHEALVREIVERAHHLYIARDGKDALVSLYDLLEVEVPFTAFLRSANDHVAPRLVAGPMDASRPRYWGYHAAAWRRRDDALHLAFEDLKADFDGTLARVLTRIGHPTPDRLRRPALPQRKLVHGVRRRLHKLGWIERPGSTSVRPRRGLVGGARAYFSAEDLDFFEREAALGARLAADPIERA